MRKMIERICQQCGKKFMVRADKVSQGIGKNCSRQCARLAQLKPAEERLWDRTDRSGGPDACWHWTAGANKGYGVLSINGKWQFAHRFSYELAHGPIPEDLCVCHTCDNPACCNPRHLFLGTLADNIHDAARKKRMASGEKNSHAKLTEPEVRQIRDEYNAGLASGRTIAKRHGIDNTTVYDIINRKSWKHVV